MGTKAEIVICGAGIAGIAAAYHLAVRRGFRDVLLVDERPPLTLTSDKSAECYRNWWPGPGDAMVALTNRSIDLLEELARESGNIFNMNRRGYLFATANATRADELIAAAEEASSLGAGPVRYHRGEVGDPDYVPAPPRGFEGLPDGIDVMLDHALIQRHFPDLTPRTRTVVHARRCGWLSAQQLGMYMLEQARAAGVSVLNGRVEAVDCTGGRVRGVRVATPGGNEDIAAPIFVNAAGPYVDSVAHMLGVEFPTIRELHLKLIFNDHLAVIGRDTPMMIWTDPVRLPWNAAERAELESNPDARYLLDEFPEGVHWRPEGGGRSALLVWTYDCEPTEAVYPISWDPHYPEIVLRGAAVMLPKLEAYFGNMPKPVVDGGYYTKTRENRPLIGPLPVEGAYINNAFSGFGIMSSCAGGDLLAAHIAGAELPHYAPAFAFARYDDPDYQGLLKNWPSSSGQL